MVFIYIVRPRDKAGLQTTLLIKTHRVPCVGERVVLDRDIYTVSVVTHYAAHPHEENKAWAEIQVK